MNKTPKLEFVQFNRDCKRNEQILSGQSTLSGSTKLLIDYGINIDGVRLATFKKYDVDQQGYRLYLMTHDCVEIPKQERSREIYFSGGERALKSEFERVVLALLAEGKIPNLEQQKAIIVQKQADKKAKDTAAWAKYCQGWLEYRTKEKANELLDLLTNVDKSSETAWHCWLGRRDRLVEYISEQPPRKESNLVAAGIYEDETYEI